jgi:transcriptional regulator with XRE-family HTH domain
MDEARVTQSSLAESLGVTPGRVSQVLRNPGNLTLKKMVEYARSLGMKVSIVAYDDDDPQNENGPINSQIFNVCWTKAGKPNDFFSVQDSLNVIRNTPLIRYVSQFDMLRKSQTSDAQHIAPLVLQEKMNTTPDSLFSVGV